MKAEKLMKNVLKCASAFIGIMVAEGIYRTSTKTLKRKEINGEYEIIEEPNEIPDSDMPF